MENIVKLDDDELSLVATALHIQLTSYQRHIKEHGEDSLDLKTIEGIVRFSDLYERLMNEFFRG